MRKIETNTMRIPLYVVDTSKKIKSCTCTSGECGEYSIKVTMPSKSLGTNTRIASLPSHLPTPPIVDVSDLQGSLDLNQISGITREVIKTVSKFDGLIDVNTQDASVIFNLYDTYNSKVGRPPAVNLQQTEEFCYLLNQKIPGTDCVDDNLFVVSQSQCDGNANNVVFFRIEGHLPKFKFSALIKIKLINFGDKGIHILLTEQMTADANYINLDLHEEIKGLALKWLLIKFGGKFMGKNFGEIPLVFGKYKVAPVANACMNPKGGCASIIERELAESWIFHSKIRISKDLIPIELAAKDIVSHENVCTGLNLRSEDLFGDALKPILYVIKQHFTSKAIMNEFTSERIWIQTNSGITSFSSCVEGPINLDCVFLKFSNRNSIGASELYAIEAGSALQNRRTLNSILFGIGKKLLGERSACENPEHIIIIFDTNKNSCTFLQLPVEKK